MAWIIWTNGDLAYWSIYATLSLNNLIKILIQIRENATETSSLSRVTKLGTPLSCSRLIFRYFQHIKIQKLDMSTARRRLKSPRSLSGTSAHPTMVTQVNIMVMNGWLTSFSFIVNQPPHSWDKVISDSDLETPRSRSWVWSKGKVIQLAQCHINSLPFHLTSIRPTIPEMELFRNLTLNHPRSRSWVRSKVKVTYCTQNPTNALPFRFTSIGHTIPEIWPQQCLTLKKHIQIF